MQISEIFVSIQAEGKDVGRPALFIRTAGCNLYCGWCDTKYSWDKGTYISEEELCQRIKDYKGDLVVFTGGEPFLQIEEILNIIPFITKLHKQIAFETNGTMFSSYYLVRHTYLFTVSPKLSNSGNLSPLHKAWLRGWDELEEKTVWKFVVGNKADLLEVKNFVEKNGIVPKRVWLMPLSITTKEHNRILRNIWPFAIENNYNISPRLQILAFGKRRGI